MPLVFGDGVVAGDEWLGGGVAGGCDICGEGGCCGNEFCAKLLVLVAGIVVEAGMLYELFAGSFVGFTGTLGVCIRPTVELLWKVA